MTDAAALVPHMLDAASRAAGFIRQHAGGIAELTWENKGPADFVSLVDRGAEEIVRDALLAEFPDAVFLGEETYDPSASLGAELAFVVDPLDGTTNFLHGFPWYAVSVGAAHAGEPIAGVVRNVVTGETFSGSRGAGAWRHVGGRRERISVSHVTEPSRSRSSTRSTPTCASSRRSRAAPPASAALAPRRSISATSPAAASRRSGS